MERRARRPSLPIRLQEHITEYYQDFKDPQSQAVFSKIPPNLSPTRIPMDDRLEKQTRMNAGIPHQSLQMPELSNLNIRDGNATRHNIIADEILRPAPIFPPSLDVIPDGLHVSNMEQDITVKDIEDVQLADGEIEAENAETGQGGGFQQ
jgi:hypothetical protein